MDNFNIGLLKTFGMVVERRSFSAAAAALGVSQPAVSQQIRRLEEEFEGVLIERVGRVLRPTPAGIELLSLMPQIEAAVLSAREAVARRSVSGEGRVRIGTGTTACIYLIPPILKDLRKRFPKLEISVTTGNTTAIVKSVEENRLDVGLVTMPVSGRAFDISPVYVDEFLLLAPADMPLPNRISAASLAKKSVLLYELGAHTRKIIDSWFAKGGVTLESTMSVDSVEAIKELVACGLGCSILPGLALQNPGRDVTVRSLQPRLERTLCTVIRHDKRLYFGLSDVVRAFQSLSSPAGLGSKNASRSKVK